jgi:hypothetical protein
MSALAFIRGLRYCRPGAVYRPFFIFRVIWVLDSFTFFVVLCVYAAKVHDPFWEEAVSGASSGFLITAIIMLLLSVCLTVLVDLNLLQVIRNLNFVLSSVVGGIVVMLVFAFKGAFGTKDSASKAEILAEEFLQTHNTSDSARWFVDHYLSGSDVAAWPGIIKQYCEGRTVPAGDALLGCGIGWLILHLISLALQIKEVFGHFFLDSTDVPAAYWRV